jgi:L-iditol 2-dehydrogenase
VATAVDVPDMMDALVVHEPNHFSVDRVRVPWPGRHEVLSRVRAVAICGTDPHIIRGDFPGFWPKAFPFVPGHEWSGDVVAVGDGAGDLGWTIGDRVAGTSHAGCGFCQKCVSGRYNVCENYGREAVHRQYGHYTQGCYAGYVVHSIRSVFHIPPDLDYERAAMLDPTSIAMHTAKRGGVQPGDCVVVAGPGVMGLLVAECAQVLGAGRVIVLGRGQRLAKAAELGFEVLDVSAGAPVQRVREMTNGIGADVSLECAGAPETLQWCIEVLRRGGRCAAIGIPLEPAQLPIQRMVLDELDLVGVRANAGEMEQVIPLVTSGRIRAGALITHRFPLRDFGEAYRTFTERTGGALKVIVQP